jgi:hypothetical protein
LIEVSVTICPMQDRHGRVIGASKIAHDITERKRVESKSKGQLARMDLLHQITRAIGRHDLDSIYRVVLRSLEKNLSLDFQLRL